jgi:hypothetical protein
MIIIILLKTLILTIIIEYAASYLMGYRDKQFFTILLLANLITNPTLNYILIVIDFFKLSNLRFYVEILLEAAVILVEYKIFLYVLNYNKGKLFLLSVIINISSYLTGIIF